MDAQWGTAKATPDDALALALLVEGLGVVVRQRSLVRAKPFPSSEGACMLLRNPLQQGQPNFAPGAYKHGAIS